MQVLFSTVDSRGNVTAYGSDGIADAIHNEATCRQADATRYATDFLDNLWQDIIDAVCVVLDSTELVTRVTKHSISNIALYTDKTYKSWNGRLYFNHEHTLDNHTTDFYATHNTICNNQKFWYGEYK